MNSRHWLLLIGSAFLLPACGGGGGGGGSTPPPPSTSGSLVAGWGDIGFVANNYSAGTDIVNGMAHDATYLYAIGYDYTPGVSNSEWRIEKRYLADGTLVAAFGTGGVITSNPSTGVDIANAIAIDGTSMYVVGTDLSPGNSQWRIEKRDLVTGALVPAFGTAGVVVTNPSAASDTTKGVAIDGAFLYVAGWDQAPGNPEWRIEKRNLSDGALVPAFGVAGVVLSNPSAGSDNANAIAIDAAAMYVVGYDQVGPSVQMRIEKRNLSDGALVAAFGTAGVIQVDPSAGGDEIMGVALDATALYFCGYDSAAPNYNWHVEKRTLSTGALVPAFGIGGVLVTNPSVGNNFCYGVALDATAFYLTGFDSAPGNSEMRLERRDLTTAALVPAFGTAGVYLSNPSSSTDIAGVVMVDAVHVYVGGYMTLAGDPRWRIESLDLVTGVPDPDFGTPGLVAEDPVFGVDSALAMTLDATCLYAVGYDFVGNGEWRVEKRKLSDGSLVPAFGTGGIVLSNPSGNLDAARAVAVDATYIYVAGVDRTPGPTDPQWRIEKRNLSNGSLVAAFGTAGAVTFNPSAGYDDIYAMAIDATSMYVVGVDSIPGSGNLEWRIEKRNLSDGALVAAFGTAGVALSNPSADGDSPLAIALDATSLYVAGVDSVAAPTDAQIRIEKRSLTTGALVPAFGVAGVVQINPSAVDDEASAIVLDATSLYIGGYDGTTPGNGWRLEKRNLSDGALVASFGTGGVISENISANPEGIAGMTISGSVLYAVGSDGTSAATVWRIEKRNLSDGALVSDFATGGVLAHDPTSGSDAVFSIVADATSIYATGREWVIEKREK